MKLESAVILICMALVSYGVVTHAKYETTKKQLYELEQQILEQDAFTDAVIDKNHQLEVKNMQLSGDVVNKISKLTTGELNLLASIVHSEAESEPFVGKAMVAKVILNRAESNNMSIEEIIFRPGQFDGINLECFKRREFNVDDVQACIAAMFLNEQYYEFFNPNTSTDKDFVSRGKIQRVIGNHVFR